MSALIRRLASRIALLVSVALVVIVLPPTTAQAAVGDVTFVGHGWGHGRGMGQYGALGYAVNHGWSSAQILNHFYGGTVAGNVGNPEMTVELTRLTGRDTIVTGNGLVINSVAAGAAAVLIRRTATGSFQVFKSSGCGGPWSLAGTLGSGLRVATSSDQRVLANLPRVCEAAGQHAYRGSLAVVSNGGTQRTINHVLTESYLRGVVPRESPASWASLGGGRGAQALRAQAVAARSYALASIRIVNVARTCDTTACQVYGGAGLLTGTTWTLTEDSRTDAAIGATAGVVRLKNGAPVRTEFSSSTGGYTAGGAFPAVADAGDSIAINPNHTWVTTLGISSIAASLGTGPIRTIVVTARNGLGAGGGRATGVTVVTTAGQTRTFTGNQVRSALALKSDWFTISGMSLAEARSIVKALYADLLLRPVDTSGLSTWSLLLASGTSQAALVGSLTKSEEYVRLRVRHAYEQVLGRAPDAGGLAGWTRAIMAGTVAVDDVQRVFLTTQEFYLRSGGTPTRYVDLLYRTVLKRPPTTSEAANWSRQIAVVGRSKVVDGIWFSMEGALYRAGRYYQLFLKRVPDRAGQELWARTMLSQGEGAVRIGIAGSNEYRLLSSKRFP
jgi:peptidoglycan hydrolase-like amidase